MKNFFLIYFFLFLTFFSAPFFYYGFGDTVLKEVRAMTLEEEGVLLIELGGTDFNQFDRIVVDEEVNLGGKLEVELIDGYSPNVGDEFEFINFGESFSDFSEMSGLDLGDGLYLMPTLGLSSYKLRVVDSSPQDAVVSFNPDDANDGSIRINTGDVFLNELYESVFKGEKSLSEISGKNFFGAVTIGGVEVSGHFEAGQNGDFAYLLMNNGSVFVESNADRKIFDGSSSGLRISQAKVAVLFDPGDKGFAMIGSGNMKSNASGLDLEGSIQIKWNKTGQTIDNLKLNIGSNFHTLSANTDVASIIGDVSLESDLANMNFSLGVQLSNYNQSDLIIDVSHGSINFSNSLRYKVSLDDISGTLSMKSGGKFATNLSGTLERAYFNGFELSQINVELDYIKSSSGETQFLVESENENNSIKLSDATIQSGFKFFASQDDLFGKEFIFYFSNINIGSDDLRVKNGSGVLIADSRGVAARLYGTASAGFQNEVTTFSSEEKLQISINTTQDEVNRTVPFERGEIDLVFSGGNQIEANYFHVSLEDAVLTIGNRLQIRGSLNWSNSEENILVGEHTYKVKTLFGNDFEIFIYANNNNFNSWVPENSPGDLGSAGFHFENVSLSIIKFVGEGDNFGKYVVLAQGQFDAQNISHAALSGDGLIQLNQTDLEIDQTITNDNGKLVRFNFAADKELNVDVEKLLINIGGEELSTSAEIVQEGDQLTVTLSEFNTRFSAGDAEIGLNNASGKLFVDNDRIYGTAKGILYKSSLPSFSITAENEAKNIGGFSVAFNSGTETVAVSSVNLPRGPYIAIHGENMVIETGGEEIRGNFLIRSGAIDGSHLSYGRPIKVGEKEQEALIIQANNVTVISNDLKGDELGIKLSGGIVLTKDQLVGELSGSLSYLDSSNDVDILVDQLTMSINAYADSFTPNESNLDSDIPGFSMSLNNKKGVFITADQFTADLGPARISGSLGLSGELLGKDAALKFQVENLVGKFGATADDPVFKMSADNVQFHLLNSGVVGGFSGLTIDSSPDVGSLRLVDDVSGATFKFNSTNSTIEDIESGQFDFRGDDLSLNMGQVQFNGSIAFSAAVDVKQLDNANNEKDLFDEDSFKELRVDLSGAKLTLPGKIGHVDSLNGFFYVSKDGFLGKIDGDIDISASDLYFKGSSELKLNTTERSFEKIVNPEDSQLTYDLPKGPFFSTSLTDASFTLLGSTVTADVDVILNSAVTGESVNKVEIGVKGMNLSGGLGAENSGVSYHLENLSGYLFADDEGVAGSLSGEMNFPKFSNGIEFSLPNASVDFNTSNSPLDHIFESKSYRFNESNFFRSTVNEGKLIKDNVEVFSGDLAFYVDLSNDVSGLDVDKLFGKVSNAKLSLGDNNLVAMDTGNGSFIVESNGLAADFSSSLIINSDDVYSRGVFSAKVNYTDSAVEINKRIGDTLFVLNLEKDLDKIIEGSSTKLLVGSQKIEGDFVLEEVDGLVSVSMRDVNVVVGDSTSDYINLKVKKGAALIDPEGIAIDAIGDAEILLTNLSASGEYRVKIKTFERQIAQQFLDQSTIFIRAGPVTEVFGTNAALTVAGQYMTGNFNFSKVEEIGMDLTLDNVNFSLGNENSYASIQNGSGVLSVNQFGVDGYIQIETLNLENLKGISFSGVSIDKTLVQFNTRKFPVSREIITNEGVVKLELPSGPYVRLSMNDVSLNLNHLKTSPFSRAIGGLDAVLKGDVFLQKTDDGLIIGLKNIESSIHIKNSKADLIQGSGIFIAQDDGVVGALEGRLDDSVGGLVGGADLILRVNNTNSSIDRTVVFEGAEIDIKFNQGNTFAVLSSDTKIDIEGKISIYGNLSISKSGDNELLAGNEVTVFFGEGPLYLENKSINPLAKGFVISEAKVGLVRSVGEGGDQHALKASGNISMIGIPEMIIEGKVNLEYNSYDTEISESIAVSDNEEINIDFSGLKMPSSDGSPYLDFIGLGVGIKLGSQNIRGGIVSIKRQKISNNKEGFRIHFNTLLRDDGLHAFSTSFSNGDHLLAQIENGTGDLLIADEGVAASINGNLKFGDEDLKASGLFKFEYNNTGIDVEENFFDNGELVKFYVPEGHYTRFSGSGEIETVSSGQSLRGDFIFQKYDKAGDVEVLVQASNVSSSFGSQEVADLILNEGVGVMIIDAEGLVGSIKGDLSFDVPEVKVEGNFDLQINTKNSEVQLSLPGPEETENLIRAGPNYFQFNGQNVTITVNDQKISGDFEFEQKFDGLVYGAVSNASLSLSYQSSTVLSIQNASGFVATEEGGFYGVLNFTNPLIDMPGIFFSANEGDILVNTKSSPIRIDGLGNGNIQEIPKGPYVRVSISDVTAELGDLRSLGIPALLKGNFAFEQKVEMTQIVASNVTSSVSVNGSSGDLHEAEGVMIVTSNGVAGYLEGELEVGVPSLAAGEALILRFNNTGSAVNEEIKLGPDNIKISFNQSEGTVFSVSLLGGFLDIGGVMSVEGDISFSSQSGYEVFGGENMRLFVGEGNLRLDSGELNPFAKGLMISEATIGVIKKDGKYALSAEGQVSVVGISGLSLSGPVSISYNGFDHLVEETVAIAATAKRVAIEFADTQVSKVVGEVKKAFYEIKGFETPIAIDVAGQRVRANFSVRRFASITGGSDDSLEFELTNLESSFGDGNSNFVTMTGGAGVLLSMPDGVVLLASGAVSVSAPEVSLSGSMDLKINNVGAAVNQGSVNLPAGPYTKFEGTGLNLVVAGQTLSGDFGFEKEANGDVRGLVEGGEITITDTGRDIIFLKDINGNFEISSDGAYGALRVGKSKFAVPGVTVWGGIVTVQMNTVDEKKTGDFDLGGVSAETLTFGAGPYLRVDLKRSRLLLEGLMSNGVDAELIGNFAFEPSDEEIHVVMDEIITSVFVNESAGILENGKGAMVVAGNGVAGALEGELAFSVPSLNAGESLVLRFNNSGSAVKKEIKRGADYINISFDQSEGRIFSASLIEDPLDVDRDGWQDETEILFGSTPSDPESVPAFKMIVQKFKNGQFQVFFPGEKDVSYTIQISSNLKDWIVLGDPIIGNGNIVRECFKISGNTSFLRITKN